MRRALVLVLILLSHASVLSCAPASSPSMARASRAPSSETSAPAARHRSGESAPVTSAPTAQPDQPATAAITPAPAPAAQALVYEELVTGGAAADDALPLVIGIHGLGDSPAGVREMAARFPGRARFVLPRAPTPYGPGFAWFPYHAGRGTAQQYADGVGSAATLVAATIRAVRASRPSAGKTVVTGFSQGGMIAYALAVQHADVVDAAIPIAGYLPTPLMPAPGTRLPPIRSMHGDADPIVAFALDEASVAALRALGADVTLRTYPGVPHTMTEAMRDDLSAEIAATLAR
jgi:phospholipase/carboxylesterase